jgi:glutamate dehydrogenase/leucine dehydrogenase
VHHRDPLDRARPRARRDALPPYEDDDEALTDVLRLSRAMTYKAACAGLDLGGGKAVIIGDPPSCKSEALLRAYGRMIASLGGRYVTACDVGTTPDDMAVIKRETRWATGAWTRRRRLGRLRHHDRRTGSTSP